MFYFRKVLLEKSGFSEPPDNAKVKPEQVGISTIFISARRARGVAERGGSDLDPSVRSPFAPVEQQFSVGDTKRYIYVLRCHRGRERRPRSADDEFWSPVGATPFS